MAWATVKGKPIIKGGKVVVDPECCCPQNNCCEFIADTFPARVYVKDDLGAECFSTASFNFTKQPDGSWTGTLTGFCGTPTTLDLHFFCRDSTDENCPNLYQAATSATPDAADIRGAYCCKCPNSLGAPWYAEIDITDFFTDISTCCPLLNPTTVILELYAPCPVPNPCCCEPFDTAPPTQLNLNINGTDYTMDEVAVSPHCVEYKTSVPISQSPSPGCNGFDYEVTFWCSGTGDCDEFRMKIDILPAPPPPACDAIPELEPVVCTCSPLSVTFQWDFTGTNCECGTQTAIVSTLPAARGAAGFTFSNGLIEWLESGQ
jgi:hypothetical protein